MIAIHVTAGVHAFVEPLFELWQSRIFFGCGFLEGSGFAGAVQRPLIMEGRTHGHLVIVCARGTTSGSPLVVIVRVINALVETVACVRYK